MFFFYLLTNNSDVYILVVQIVPHLTVKQRTACIGGPNVLVSPALGTVWLCFIESPPNPRQLAMGGEWYKFDIRHTAIGG